MTACHPFYQVSSQAITASLSSRPVGGLVAKANPQGPCRAYEAARRRNGLQPPDGLGDLHGRHLRALVGDHLAEPAGSNQFHGFGAEDRAKGTIKIRRAAASLQMSQDADAGLLAGAFLDLRGHDPRNAAQSGFAVGDLLGRGDIRPALLPGALRPQ